MPPGLDKAALPSASAWRPARSPCPSPSCAAQPLPSFDKRVYSLAAAFPLALGRCIVMLLRAVRLRFCELDCASASLEGDARGGFWSRVVDLSGDTGGSWPATLRHNDHGMEPPSLSTPNDWSGTTSAVHRPVQGPATEFLSRAA